MIILPVLLAISSMNCTPQDDDTLTPNDIKGYQLLTDLTGHWVGENETAFGNYNWFAFDFRPISASHVHSIYEGSTNENIITSVFIADFEGKQQIMARNGGWLGNQYRATYFVLDIATDDGTSKYYRLVDAVGRENRAYMEFRFENDTLYFDAYKDNSGSLDVPIHHMGFKGVNMNPSFAQMAVEHFDFPQPISEVDLNGQFTNLIDPDSALFLEENNDPFPKSRHGYISDLTIHFDKHHSITDDRLLLYISTESLIDANGQVNFDYLNTKVIRTIDIQTNEVSYTATYLHPGRYFVTAFTDKDANFYPSQGDVSNVSTLVEVTPEQQLKMSISIDMTIN